MNSGEIAQSSVTGSIFILDKFFFIEGNGFKQQNQCQTSACLTLTFISKTLNKYSLKIAKKKTFDHFFICQRSCSVAAELSATKENK
jgi:polyferredoxin